MVSIGGSKEDINDAMSLAASEAEVWANYTFYRGSKNELLLQVPSVLY